jgi:hypothetical protein
MGPATAESEILLVPCSSISFYANQTAFVHQGTSFTASFEADQWCVFMFVPKMGNFHKFVAPHPLRRGISSQTKAHPQHVGHATNNRSLFTSAYFGALCCEQKGYPKKPHFSCFSKFNPHKGSKIQIPPRNDPTQCGTRFFDVESACVAVLEVPNPKRERVTEKRDTISLNQHGAGGRTAVKLPQLLTKWSQFFLN